MRLSFSLAAAILAALTVVPAAAQQTHTAPSAALDAAIEQHVAAANRDREDVRRVLAHPEVAAVAREAGIDLRRVAGAAALLGGEELARVAAQARQVERALAGGQGAISTTTIIIVLLVVILIVVAVD
ncbi:MAG TPA: hypothetical protein VNI78_00360 [Vicinamibacterales bacterium]|nr:hypothetical protein [Vicinamibacterales bacterium]